MQLGGKDQKQTKREASKISKEQAHEARLHASASTIMYRTFIWKLKSLTIDMLIVIHFLQN